MNKAFFYIIAGAALWGTIGWYVKHLYLFGFTPMEVVTLRVWSTAILLVGFTLFTGPKRLLLKKTTDLAYFIGTGVFSFIFFNFCLFTAMALSSLPVATALLYTGPAFVTIFSYFLFKEKLTKSKWIALIISFFGTALVVELFPLESIPVRTILFGLGSALGYALYSIFSKFALKKYSSMQITTFTFIVAAIVLLPFFPYETKLSLLQEPSVLLYSFGLGFLPTAFAYIIYTHGLHRTEASKASILTTVEPVVASIIGILVFQEPFSFVQMAGMACIIAAVILLQLYNTPGKPLMQAAEPETNRHS